MMTHIAVLSLLVTSIGANPDSSQTPYAVDEKQRREADALLHSQESVEIAFPNPHPDAQWYPQAGLGLFMHWGIHSVAGIQPSWAMIKDYPAGGDARFHPPAKYYALARKFNPRNYDPDKWLAAAKGAGFTYAVLTTKHHDGYALWPTRYGNMSTRRYMDGRDLLRPYVDACRKHGLKVGFYFSPRDWHYPGYPVGDVGFDFNKRRNHRPIQNPEQNRKDFEAFYAYTIGQLRELLTRYGKIDVLWFDGMGWHEIGDIRTKQTLSWIRKLQPGIVLNDRWGGVGDFHTPEWNLPKGHPEGWWENCVAVNGHWGYNPRGRFWPSAKILERLVRIRSWGGNFLLNVGPAPDGTMPPGFYERCDQLAAWMAHSGESVRDVAGGPYPLKSNVPVTVQVDVWYCHGLGPGNRPKSIDLRDVTEPITVTLLGTREKLDYVFDNKSLHIVIPADKVTGLVDVVAVRWR